MNGIRLLLLLAATAQVGDGKERDFGWQINADDGVVEYLVQIKPAEVLAMQNKSLAFPNGQEDVSNMPPELVGRVSRIVVRIGDEVLPRTPSLQELDQLPRRGASLNSATTAQLGPGRMQDLEANNVFNIQQNNTPALPNLPSGLPSGAESSLGSQSLAGQSLAGQSENLIDQVAKADALRDNIKGGLTDALPAFPDPSTLAQNFNNPQGGSSFLNEARGSKFNSTAPPAGAPATQPVGLPPAAVSNAPFSNANPGVANASSANRNSSATGNPGSIAGAAGLPLYPDPRLNPPSLAPSQSGLPQQQTPAAGFGTSPNLANRQPSGAANSPGPANNWNTSPTTAGGNSYAPSMPSYADPYAQSSGLGQPSFSQPSYAPPNFTNAPLPGASPFPQNQQLQTPGYDRIAMDNKPLTNPAAGRATQANGSNLDPSSAIGNSNAVSQNPQYLGNPATTVDGVLQVLFLLSLVVNFYLGILIRKLLMRYRSLLTNVRSQTA